MKNKSSIIIESAEDACLERLNILLKTNAALSKWKKLASSSTNRYYRLKELITTEEDYYNDLKTLHEKIKMPLI
jgi:hypothetical protein